MQIDGRTKICGLIGCPVEHTLSPLIHNMLSELLGINLAYAPFPVQGEGLGEAVRGAYALGMTGLNVTVPHKEKVLSYLVETDRLAEKIGAVNTLVRSDGGYKGYNTDMPGLCRAMASDGIHLEGEQVLILGAGGVARAVAVMLADKAENIWILNRTVGRASMIAEEVNAYAGRQVARALSLTEYGMLPAERFLAVQATNVGMYPAIDNAIIEEKDFYEKVHTGYDLIYNPARTKFMRFVEEAGGAAFNGLKMLLYQGIIAYELWNRISIPDTKAEEVYKRLKENI